MRYRKIFPHIFFVILVGVFVVLNNSGEDKINSPQINNIGVSAEKETAKVARVFDGDTIEVSLNNKKETVRLIGIDAPETVDPRKTIQCFGKEASEKAKEMLDGKIITLESDPTQADRDKYGRFLRYVFLGGMNFNRLMISEGFAREYAYQNNPYKYIKEFKNAQKTAREEKRGLWKDNICEVP